MSDVADRCGVCQALLDEEDLFCPNCGTAAPDGGMRTGQLSKLLATHNFECHGCGASMSYDASAQALRCPFCGSDRLDGQVDTTVVAPQRVVPFRIARHDALSAMRRWLKRGFWRPRDLSSAATVAKITAVYIPYWVFSARTHAYWTADTSQTPWGARGDWCPISGEHRGKYEGLLVGASGALTPAETMEICPFAMTDARKPADIDLEHAIFEQLRVPRKYARPLACQGLEELVRQECSRLVPGRCRNLKANLRIEGLTSEAVFLPVWIMAYRYRDRVYRFLLNGQSGKATGDAPTSWKKIAAVAGGMALTVGILIAAAIMAS